MGSNKHRQYIDPTVYSTSKNAFDLLSNAVRQSLIYNAYEGKTIFNAVVLTTPVVLSELDLNYKGPVAKTGADRISRFMFKGRILDEPGMPTPHEFIPDPCDLEINTNDDEQITAAMEIIALHTTFVSSTQQELTSGGEYTKPKVGDKVRVELQGNVFSYNLQVGTFLEVVSDSTISGKRTTDSSGNVVHVEDRSRSECVVLSNLFDVQEKKCKDDYKDCLDNMIFEGDSINIHYGSGSPAPAGSAPTPYFPLLLGPGESIVVPCEGRFTSAWSPARVHPKKGTISKHAGIDMANSTKGTGIYAIADGVVESINLNPNGGCKPKPGGGGTIISISHPGLKNIKRTKYMHIHKVHPDLKKGDSVKMGQNIAIMGTTGCSTGNHLHFEVYNQYGSNCDPIQSLGIQNEGNKFGMCNVYGSLHWLGRRASAGTDSAPICKLPSKSLAKYKKYLEWAR